MTLNLDKKGSLAVLLKMIAADYVIFSVPFVARKISYNRKARRENDMI